MHQKRLLFCLPTTAMSGGAKIIFEFANRLNGADLSVDIFAHTGPPAWFPLTAPLLAQKDLGEVPWHDYDFVFICHAFMIPVVMQCLVEWQSEVRGGRKNPPQAVYFCQDYESFHHGHDACYEDFIADDPTFAEIYRLPLPIVTVSRAVQSLIRDRIGREAFYTPLGIDKTIYRKSPRSTVSDRKRVLMIGNYLWPSKGMPDAFEALTQISRTLPVELVLVTPETRNPQILNALPFPVELHRKPSDSDMPAILAGCDVFCCASWYEGLGLPGLEAFHCGVPVVSTRDYGVEEYGIDGVNIVLANPNDPEDLRRALDRVLTDDALAGRLQAEALRSVTGRYEWSDSVASFLRLLREIEDGSPRPAVDRGFLADLADRMEIAGNYTPAVINRTFKELAQDLKSQCHALIADTVSRDNAFAEIHRISERLHAHLHNPHAEYYSAYRAQYDLSRVVLALEKHPRMRQALTALLARRDRVAAEYTPNVREVHYAGAESS